MADRVTIREAARRLGIKHPSVHRQAHRWNLIGQDRLLDFDELVRLRAAALEPGQALRQVVERAEAAAPSSPASHDGHEPPPSLSTAAALAYKDAQTELLRMELARRRGELVDRASVEEAAMTSTRMCRDALLALPAKLGPLVAGLGDQVEIRRILTEHIRAVLVELAAAHEALADGDRSAMVDALLDLAAADVMAAEPRHEAA